MASTNPLASAPAVPNAPLRRAIESRDPRTGECWRTWQATSSDAVHLALAEARAAQSVWQADGLARRRRVLGVVRRTLHERRREIAETISREVGKTPGEALGTEVLVALEHARWLTTVGARALAPIRHRSRALAFARKTLHVERVPLGVVAVISPWNYPFMLAASPMLSALLAGNAVLLKPSEFATATGQALVEALHAAGVPEALVQCLPGDAVTGEALVRSGVNKVFFTGSTPGGRAVAAAAGREMTPVSLELGGADAAIVLADADLLLAARGLLWGRFANAGQSCTAPKRVYVEAKVYDGLMAALISELSTWRAGRSPADDLGPLIRATQTELLHGQLQDATELGATVVAQVPASEDVGHGDPVPTACIVTGITPAMRISREETFGPLLTVTPVTSVDAAITAANTSPYGLSASLWTRSTGRARQIAAQLDVGTVMINDVLVNAGIPDLAHGGIKASGTGRSHGIEGLLECTTTRTVVHDALPSLPQLWWRLAADAQWPVYDAVATVLHGTGLRARGSAVFQLLRALRWRRSTRPTS